MALAKIFELPGLEDVPALTLSAFADATYAECERMVGLNRASPEFRRGIADAVFFSSCLHKAPPKRASDLRKQLTRIEKHARNAAAELQQLSKALALISLTERPPKTIAALIRPTANAELLDFAETMRTLAETLEDRGGRGRMAGFALFVPLLADAFGRATGRRATLTWNEHNNCYEGQFWELIDHVLPRAEIVAGDRFAPKGPIARGRHAQRILTAMDKTPAV
jgi:hypothetical protein